MDPTAIITTPTLLFSPMPDRSTSNWHEFPLDLAERCVKCAQCLPVCPTWQLARHEAESPRGRIALMTAAADGTAADDSSVRMHLDQCLRCGQCEVVCPAEVPFLALADAAAAATDAARRAPWQARLLRFLVVRPRLFNRVVVPLLRAASRLPWLHPLLVPGARPAPSTGTYGPFEAGNGQTVSLFLGCIARATDGATLSAALRALRIAGYTVRVPRQSCCGALHAHAGEGEAARALHEANATAFDDNNPVVHCASGCAATLRSVLGARVVDVSTLLARTAETRVAGADTVLHTPCTFAATSEAAGPARLLTGMRPLSARGRCCGAAGEYLLREPALAARLRDEVLDEVGTAATLCTSNPGCALHLRAGLAKRGMRTTVS
ncbi:MAG: (Fe-S)-binding protein, partial [Xanthomonadaceae bacterium]|nr:(Fe-S)-binding protein [Xanthomonadaceae bacterium]